MKFNKNSTNQFMKDVLAKDISALQSIFQLEENSFITLTVRGKTNTYQLKKEDSGFYELHIVDKEHAIYGLSCLSVVEVIGTLFQDYAANILTDATMECKNNDIVSQKNHLKIWDLKEGVEYEDSIYHRRYCIVNSTLLYLYDNERWISSDKHFKELSDMEFKKYEPTIEQESVQENNQER